MQGTFNEIMELRDFPFDFQDLTIKCQTGLLTQGGQGAARPPWQHDCIGFAPTSC